MMSTAPKISIEYATTQMAVNTRFSLTGSLRMLSAISASGLNSPPLPSA